MADLQKRVEALCFLGDYINTINDSKFSEILNQAYQQNPWFTIENSKLSLSSIQKNFLQKDKLTKWLSKYEMNISQKKIGLVLAGNIPAVGWNDIMCTFLAGHKSLIKYSDKDKVIIKHLLDELINAYPEFSNHFEEVDFLKNMDAVIATGSDNSARYFKAYFGKYPHIIRKNRNGVAVLDGSETYEDLTNLGHDIFSYFGLGCRNVSKIYVPESYDFNPLLEALHTFNYLINHNKYKNNFDYNIALYLLNKESFKNNGCLILKEDKRIPSRISSLHFEYYADMDNLSNRLKEEEENIQCIVTNKTMPGFKSYKFGEAQDPGLDDYADGIDTMEFLCNL